MALNLFIQHLLPQHILSRLVAKIANCRISFIKNFVIKHYCKLYHVDMVEALESHYFNYPCFNAFFTRALKPDARPIAGDNYTIISPVDGKVWQIGKVDNDLISAKGKSFTLEQLLADPQDASQFNQGSFAVLYLAPNNYHRVHMPISGKLLSMRYVPGKLISVNPSVVDHMPDVFAKNERVIAIFDTVLGQVAVVFVGAIIVGSIVTKWAGMVVPNEKKSIICWDYGWKNITFEKGVEIGHFQLGSTVILLFPKDKMKWDESLHPETPIKMGQSLGAFVR